MKVIEIKNAFKVVPEGPYVEKIDDVELRQNNVKKSILNPFLKRLPLGKESSPLFKRMLEKDGNLLFVLVTKGYNLGNKIKVSVSDGGIILHRTSLLSNIYEEYIIARIPHKWFAIEKLIKNKNKLVVIGI